jgi:hypothetical protein
MSRPAGGAGLAVHSADNLLLPSVRQLDVLQMNRCQLMARTFFFLFFRLSDKMVKLYMKM